MRIVTAVTAVTAVALGAFACVGAFAQTAPPKGQKAVTKWMTDNKITQDAVGESWRQVASNEEGLHLRRVRLENPLKPPNAKTKTIVMRLELYNPTKAGTSTINSIAFDYDLDCQNNKYRQVVINAYPDHNLTGRPLTEMINDELWAPVADDQIMKAVATDVCPDISGNKGGQLGGSHGRAGGGGGR